MTEKLNPKEFFQQQADAYDRVHYGGSRSFMTVRLQCVLDIIKQLDIPSTAHVLDAGCGPGHFSLNMAKQGYTLSAVDTSEAMLKEFSRNTEKYGIHSNIDKHVASIEELPFADNSFDLVCSLGVIEYLKSDDKVLREFNRILRPGGLMILSVTNFWSPAGYLDFFVESAKRSKYILNLVNFIAKNIGKDPIRPRYFKIRRHRPSALRRSLTQNNYAFLKDSYFYMLPWPHPIDRILPDTTAVLGNLLEGLSQTRMGILGEGYIVCGRKPDNDAAS